MKLTQLARQTLENYFNNKETSIPNEKKFLEKGACFVTLTLNNELRGCIGSLEARQSLGKDIIENSLNAAFSDPRFPELKKEELKKIKIEVSILSKPEKLNYKDETDLLKKINHKMGIILSFQGKQATFLPQVWEQLPDKIEFLEALSNKAGLSKDAWKKASFEFYLVKKQKEN